MTKRSCWYQLASAALFLSLFAASAFPEPPAPEVVPACGAPQPINPLLPIGGTAVSARQGIVWNGKEFVVAYANSPNVLVFQRVFADGTPDGPPVVNPGGSGSYAYYTFPVSLAFDGSSYAAAFIGPDGSGYWQVLFVKLDMNFNPLVAAKRVSFVGATPTAHTYWPQIAAGGGQYCIVWHDARGAYYQVYATVLNGDGSIANAGAAHDLALSATAANQLYPSVAWSPVGANGTGGFQVVWQDFRNAKWEIWGDEWSACCGLNYLNTIVSPPAGNSTTPHLVYGPNWAGLAWDDTRDGNDEIYFALLTSLGYRSGGVVRLTNDLNTQQWPYVCWTGSEFGVFYDDGRYGALGDGGFQRVSSGGVPQGVNTQVTSGLGSSAYLAAAFAKVGYLAAGFVSSNRNYAQAFGCNYPYSPPCPSNLVAYAITGTSATLAWQPSLDPYTDIAYYQVYRNNGLVGTTANTYFTDTGLALSTTYNYLVSAVNAADLSSSGCGSTNTVYVKTNATLLLMVNKSAPNAALSWTDATMNNYNVFRGTSPQVMQQIGSTASLAFSDPNVLNDNVLYFYTVDEPGW